MAFLERALGTPIAGALGQVGTQAKPRRRDLPRPTLASLGSSTGKDPARVALVRLGLAEGAQQLSPIDSWMLAFIRNPEGRRLLEAAETGGYRAFVQGATERWREQTLGGGDPAWYQWAVRPENFLRLWDLYLKVKSAEQLLRQPRREPPTSGAPSGPLPGSGSSAPGPRPQPGPGPGSGVPGPFVSYLLPWY